MSSESVPVGPSGSPFERQYAEELARRQKQLTVPTVYEIQASDVNIKSLPGGAIWGVVGVAGSRTISSLISALQSRNYAVLDQLARAQLTLFTSSSNLGQKLGIGTLSDIPVLADLQYGGRRIAGGLFANSSLDALIAVMPYNGGPLNHGKFQLAQYSLPSQAANLQSVIVIRQPVLSDVEQQILGQVSADVSEVFVGEAGDAAYPGVVAGLVVIGLLFAGAYVFGRWARQQVQQQQQQQQDQQQQDQQQQDQDQQDQGDQDQGGQDQDHQNDSGSLSNWGISEEQIAQLEAIDPSIAAEALLEIRSEFVAADLLEV